MHSWHTQRTLRDHSENTQRTLTSLAERTHVPRRAIVISIFKLSQMEKGFVYRDTALPKGWYVQVITSFSVGHVGLGLCTMTYR